MADLKISQLSSATTPLAGTEVLPIVQSGATVKVTNNDLRPKQIQSSGTSGVLQITGPAAASTRLMTVPDANFTAARTDAAQTFTGTQTYAGSITKNMVNAGTSGSPSYDVTVQYNVSGTDRCQIRAYNIAQNLNTRTWWAVSGTNDSGTQIEMMSWNAATLVSTIAGTFNNSTDNTYSCGTAALRWSVIYAGTGTINTSDANAKEQIENLSAAEIKVAQRIKGLIKKFKFKDAVAAKGSSARLHVGVIAQEVQAAFVAEGLNAENYGIFCSDTWYEVDGKSVNAAGDAYTQDSEGAVEVTRLGVRYEELLAFVIAAL
jgi:hypothetical protein